MNKQVEKLMPLAYALLEKEQKSKQFNKELKGYIASFGPSLRMSGLLATMAFYLKDKEDKNDKYKRSDVLEWLFCMIGEEKADKKFFAIANQESDTKELANKLRNAYIALKLVFRTFSVEENNLSNH
ncbi:MAG: type III-B CRISPR module-associated protein Cmr5 [Chitinophagales bacterium]|nr:type III-B CRISPR module-associated protein Cmr5 [Chitinophagales bacterium]